jgi:hypothetical protein
MGHNEMAATVKYPEMSHSEMPEMDHTEMGAH